MFVISKPPALVPPPRRLSMAFGNNKEFSNQPNTKACEVMCNQERLALCEDKGSSSAAADSIIVVPNTDPAFHTDPMLTTPAAVQNPKRGAGME
ncbi:hypothetical protein SRHO_G00138830 [Serrasalmus rhombeus]